MGLLFAHRELDQTGYFDTDRDEPGYDVINDKVGIMYSVVRYLEVHDVSVKFTCAVLACKA